jgi:ketosteroid isomerase-like protein
MSAFVATPTAFTREGDVIVETGTYSFNMKQDAGEHAMRGTYSHRWSRMPDGSWRIISATIQ